MSGWLLASAAVFLTLAPRTFRPQTGVEHHLEHVLAFALLGLAFGLGYPGRRLLLALLGVAMAALLERRPSHWPPHDEGRSSTRGEIGGIEIIFAGEPTSVNSRRA